MKQNICRLAFPAALFLFLACSSDSGSGSVENDSFHPESMTFFDSEACSLLAKDIFDSYLVSDYDKPTVEKSWMNDFEGTCWMLGTQNEYYSEQFLTEIGFLLIDTSNNVYPEQKTYRKINLSSTETIVISKFKSQGLHYIYFNVGLDESLINPPTPIYSGTAEAVMKKYLSGVFSESYMNTAIVYAGLHAYSVDKTKAGCDVGTWNINELKTRLTLNGWDVRSNTEEGGCSLEFLGSDVETTYTQESYTCGSFNAYLSYENYTCRANIGFVQDFITFSNGLVLNTLECF